MGGFQNDGEDGRWPANRTLRVVWREGRRCSGGVNHRGIIWKYWKMHADLVTALYSGASTLHAPVRYIPYGIPRTGACSVLARYLRHTRYPRSVQYSQIMTLIGANRWWDSRPHCCTQICDNSHIPRNILTCISVSTYINIYLLVQIYMSEYC